MSRRLMFHSTTARAFIVLLAVVLFCLAASTSVLAAPPAQAQPGDEQCNTCHVPESTAWEKSPHARQDVKCETCHGPYVPGHPEKGVMQLTSDPKVCIGCHTETATQWKNSMHAGANVACTSCHVSHSQDTRLSNQWLCGSCHSDHIQDFTHSAHYTAGVTCINCHASKSDEKTGGAPSHSFTVINTQACLDCHSKTIHEQVKPAAAVTASLRPVAVATENNEALATQYDALKRSNQTLKAVSVFNLGIGLGVGGLLGIVFVLGVFFLTSRGGKAK